MIVSENVHASLDEFKQLMAKTDALRSLSPLPKNLTIFRGPQTEGLG